MAITFICSKKDYIATWSKDGRIKVYKDLKFAAELKGHPSWINCMD